MQLILKEREMRENRQLKKIKK